MDWEASICFKSNCMSLVLLQHRFPLIYESTKVGVPAGEIFTTEDFVRPGPITPISILMTDCVCAMRCHIQIIKVCESGRGRCNPFTTDSDPWIPIGYSQHITPILNNSLRNFSIRLPSEFDLNAESIRSSLEWYHHSTISVVSKNLNEYAARPAYMNILDPTAPCSEPDTSQGDGIFGKRFGIPFQDEETRLWFARAASTSELLAAYSIPESMLSFPSIVVDTINNIDQLLAGGMPYRICHASLNPDQQSDSIEDNFDRR